MSLVLSHPEYKRWNINPFIEPWASNIKKRTKNSKVDEKCDIHDNTIGFKMYAKG